MNKVTYSMSKEEQTALSENVRGIVSEVRNDSISTVDLQCIARLLQVNNENFDKFKAETWFKKAWLVLSGQRGKLTDISINNLGQIQLGVLKLLSEILKDSTGIKNDLLMVFHRFEKIQKDSIELQQIVLKFNQKYEKRFHQLQKEIKETSWSLKLSQLALGLGCIVGASLIFAPGVKEQYWHFGIIGGGITGAFLLMQCAIGIKRRWMKPIPVGRIKKVEISPEQQNIIAQACHFVGLEETTEEELVDRRVFKVDNKNNDIMDYFTLSQEEQRLLFSMQYHLCYIDKERTSDPDTKKRKTAWLEAWQQIIEERLHEPLVTSPDILFTGLIEVRQEKLALPKIGTILLESSLFIPYYSLGSRDFDQELVYDQIDLQEQIGNFCNALRFSSYLIQEAMKINEEALKNIPKKGFFEGIWDVVSNNPYKVLAAAILLAITGGLAAPAIGGAVGATMGLSGAVAIKAGLAFLGGGAIAAGGFGITGGTAMLIGGGAILGAGSAAGLINVFSSSSYLVLRELAKMEAIAKVFLSNINDGKIVIEKIIEKQVVTVKKFEAAANHAKLSGDKDRVIQLNEGVRYCKKAIERLESFIHEYNVNWRRDDLYTG